MPLPKFPAKPQVAANFSQAAPGYDDYAILTQEVGDRLLSRLPFFKAQPKQVLDLGCGTGLLSQKICQEYPDSHILAIDFAVGMLQHAQQQCNAPNLSLLLGDADYLPLPKHSCDWVLSNCLLPWMPDVSCTLAEVARVLQPEGLFLFTTLGPDTLQELRLSGLAADTSPRVHPFLDMHDIGDSLLKAGFSAPVMERDEITMTYGSVDQLLQDLKQTGSTNLHPDRLKTLMTPRQLDRIRQQYTATFAQPGGTIPATFEIITGHAFASDLSKQTLKTPQGDAMIPADSIPTLPRPH